MINIIKSDIYRVTKHAALYIAAVIMLFMLGFSIYIVMPGRVMTTGVSETVEQDPVEELTDGTITGGINDMTLAEMREFILNSDLGGYELDREILSVNANLYYVFLFIIVLVITVDFSAGSAKNTLSSAISRKKYFISKTALAFLLCLIFFFLNTYITYFANLIVNQGKVSSDLGTVTRISLTQLPAMLALWGILTGIAFMVKKTSLFNVITIPLLMVFQLLLSAAIALFRLDSGIARFEPQAMISSLANDPSSEYFLQCCLLCGVVLVVFLGAGYVSFRKSEIK